MTESGIPSGDYDIRHSLHGLRFGDFVEIEGKGDVLVAHLKGTIQRNLTKKTIEGILEGYPPWYRESLSLGHGRVAPFPIQSSKDLARAGWVIAVGLGKGIEKPLPFHVDYEKLNDKPIKRVWEILKYKLKPHFPTDANLEAACGSVYYMWREQTPSGSMLKFTEDLKREWFKKTTLNEDARRFAIAIFNDYDVLAEQEKDTLKQILFPVIIAAVSGVQVIDHLGSRRNSRRKISVPEILRHPERPVFVRDCIRS